jgi:hypothetical protein
MGRTNVLDCFLRCGANVVLVLNEMVLALEMQGQTYAISKLAPAAQRGRLS